MEKKVFKVRKPNIFTYSLFKLCSLIISKFIFNLKIKRNEIKNVKGPYVIVANHESFIDFINLACCTKRRINFVVSYSFYNSMKIHGLIKQCGAIPKQQFQTTITDLKHMKQVINANRPLGIYPAGLMPENGISTYIPKGTGKLLKWLDCDVYFAKTEGSYLTNPKWGKCGFRKGKITLDVYKLYDRKDVKELDENTLQVQIEKELEYNSYDEQEKNMVPFKKGDNIVGLENVLFKCLKCNNEFTHQIINKNTMICSSCSHKVSADKYGFLSHEEDFDYAYKKVSDWSKHIEKNLFKEIDLNEDYLIEDYATIAMIDYKKHSFKDVGNCNISLSRKGFNIIGKVNDQDVNLTLSSKEFIILPSKPGKHFEIQHGLDIYRIKLNNPSATSKWMMVLKSLYKIHHKTKETV